MLLYVNNNVMKLMFVNGKIIIIINRLMNVWYIIMWYFELMLKFKSIKWIFLRKMY